jgi:hypothetical protein
MAAANLFAISVGGHKIHSIWAKVKQQHINDSSLSPTGFGFRGGSLSAMN